MPSNGKTGPVQMQRTPRACPLSLRRGDCQERGDTSVQRRTSSSLGNRCVVIDEESNTSSAPLNLSGAGLEVERYRGIPDTAFLTAAAASSSCRHPPSPHPPSSGSLHLEHRSYADFICCIRLLEIRKMKHPMIQMQRTRAPPRVQPPPVTSPSRVVTPTRPLHLPFMGPNTDPIHGTFGSDQIRSRSGMSSSASLMSSSSS